jgi:hypothetical protein
MFGVALGITLLTGCLIKYPNAAAFYHGFVQAPK